MPSKTFTAATWEEAIASVKRELGEQAVILSSSTRPGSGGAPAQVVIRASNDAGEIERAARDRVGVGVSAFEQADAKSRANYQRLVERAYALGAVKRAEAEGESTGEGRSVEMLKRDVDELKALVKTLAKQREAGVMAELPRSVQAVFERLENSDVTPDTARHFCLRLVEALTGPEFEDETRVLKEAERIIAAEISIGGAIRLSAGRARTVAFVGPTGVGKTTTLSKLAANFKLKDGATVGFITVDTYRLGATEQLKTLASILEVPVRIVMTPGEVRAAMAELRDRDVVFLDTAGRSPKDQMRMNELRAFLDAAEPDETHLVVSATTHPRHLEATIERFGNEHTDRLVLTKLDEAATYGPALDVIRSANKPLSYITIGQDIPEDIELADGRRIARLLLGMEDLLGGGKPSF